MRTSESKDELVSALAYIETHPEEWRQDVWVCGTSACLGGHAAMLSTEIEAITRRGDMICGPLVHLTDGRTQDLSTWLKNRYPGSHLLWSGTNTLDVLQDGVKAYVNDEDVGHAVFEARRRHL